MNLILTFDYELFGNGSGDIFKHVILPTDKILSICDTYGIKTTIFFEVVEYWSLKEEWDKGNDMGYSKNPIEAMESQLQTAFRNGHDIQLHFHPQWLGAKFINDKWDLNLKNWRLSDFSETDGLDQFGLIKKGVETLQDIIKPLNPDYKPSIIRAGGYNIMPSFKIAQAMLENGIIVDSSVYPGGVENGEYSKYDYSEVPNDLDYWFTNEENVTQRTTSGTILEIPIFALPITRWKKYNKVRIKSILVNKKSALESIQAKTSKTSLVEKVKYWFQKESITWDFCLFDIKAHKHFIKYIDHHLKGKRKTFVLVGHPKNFTDEVEFEKFIKLSLKNFGFLTLDGYSKSLIEKKIH
ncbi:hypothetical protein [Cecembia lonarensis]|uniref:NodB homology domain-containing protein n=1 Tax=Cecembia lonarensis (strain CCUG 58316 / KCTC 22772 / LW9) TaxID=1225176 RepID=K1L9M9_CECL9|nr:hypothetical protein [Cecembia lonarensis]EKB51331.1 hypothetical protein B879_00125 [Cecembia lonarensis LW9]